MAQPTQINILKIDRALEINNGDLFLIETVSGTRLLDFANLVITEANTTFTTSFSTNALAIATLSAQVLNDEINNYVTFNYISANVSTFETNVNTSINSITNSLAQVSAVQIGTSLYTSITSLSASYHDKINQITYFLDVLWNLVAFNSGGGSNPTNGWATHPIGTLYAQLSTNPVLPLP